MSAALEKKPPFKTVLGHALVKDEKGDDMHKSAGNAIWFEDAAEEIGVDVLRWMFSAQILSIIFFLVTLQPERSGNS
jgi:isoleucyl-tRNA synthetase